jgi:hypothetical protein
MGVNPQALFVGKRVKGGIVILHYQSLSGENGGFDFISKPPLRVYYFL